MFSPHRDFQIDFQQTLLSYLKVLLTEYQDGYVEKTEEVIRLIEDKRAIGELLTTLTKSKVSLEIHYVVCDMCVWCV